MFLKFIFVLIFLPVTVIDRLLGGDAPARPAEVWTPSREWHEDMAMWEHGDDI